MSNTHVTVGHGPHRVVALHGWFGSASGWGALPVSIDRDAFTWTFMDYRGYGGMRGSGGPYTMDAIADDALALADRLGFERFSLVGHSMGGMAIQRVLARAPDRVRRLVGIAPVSAGGVPFDDAGWQLFSSAAGNAEARRAIIGMTTGNRLTRAWVDWVVRHSMEHSDTEAFEAYLTAWAKTEFVDEIRGKPVPVKVIVGEHDPALGADTARAIWLQHYPNCELFIMPNAGHYPPDETPVALATEIERFLAADGS